MSSKACRNCGSTETEVEQAQGEEICTNCGTVLSENIIVSEVTFEKNASGGTNASGRRVDENGMSSGSIMYNTRNGSQRNSRAITEDHGYRTITHVAQQLQINKGCIDTAHRFFKLAVGFRFTQGRRHGNTVAACLYLACRTRHIPVMLLDFCDVLQTNVFELGKTYLQLCAMLSLKKNEDAQNIPFMDPSIYIVRFAWKLQFGDKTHAVIKTAERLLKRMTRDWIHAGRRPAGVCGAALLVAARMHEFNRTLTDIIRVVKVCTATVRKRLYEFAETPSGQLSVEDFRNIDLEEEQDPPAFKASRLKARMQEVEDQDKIEDASDKINEFYNKIERHLEKKKHLTALNIEARRVADGVLEVDANQEEEEALKFIEKETIGTIENFINDSGRNVSPTPSEDRCAPSPSTSVRWGSPVAGTSSSIDWGSAVCGLGPTAASLGLKDTITECLKINETVDTVDDGELDLTGIDDSELDAYIMTPDEAMRKSDLWHVLNADYLKEQKEKEEREALQREEDAGKPEKAKRKPRKKRKPIVANTAGEAMVKMLQEKKLSKLINYDVLLNITGATSAPTAEKSDDCASTFNSSQSSDVVNQPSSSGVPVSSLDSKIDYGPPIVIDDADERKRLQEARSNSKGFSVNIGGVNRTKRPAIDLLPQPDVKKVKIDEHIPEPVIEMDTVVEEGDNPAYAANCYEDEEEEGDEEEDDYPSSAARMLWGRQGDGGNDEDHFNEYDDYFD